ncbi:cadherin-17 [Betta splendens]|uniref:Cadherin-17 n=1 Tax=Betta splendens TaxID=158456 RepID=A0A6P7KUH6_BETSP|nr:cadherin-17 [Betta splendens]
MTPMVHLLLLPLLFSITCGKDLEEKKGPFQNAFLNVPEATPVPYPIHQFQVTHPDVDNFRLSGEGEGDIRISKDGWLYLENPLKWSQDNNYVIKVEALTGEEVVEGPIYVTINVLDVNNNAPHFNQSDYTAAVRENSPAGVPFTRVFALDEDDPESPNARLSYSLVSQIPNKHGVLLFQVDPVTGEVSTTEEGQRRLKAREAIQYSSGEDPTVETLRRKFSDYCPGHAVPYEANPFFTCVERAEKRRWDANPLEDPDYTLLLRVQDLGGASPTALSGNAKVHVVVQQNLWVNPGPMTIAEHWKQTYPVVIAKVQSNEPGAFYSLVQKEREMRFPFQIRENGEILLTEELDREVKSQYILVVLARDEMDNEVEPPMEIQVVVKDINDRAPACENEESVFEVQEDEPIGSMVDRLQAHDDDEPHTLNSQLTYTIVSQEPPGSARAFSIDGSLGTIQTLQMLQRRRQQVYKLHVRVSDPDFSTECKVTIKVIDVNNELPVFETTHYDNATLAEDTAVGHTVLVLRATDADDPDSGSSRIQFHITAGNEGDVFTVETDGSGVGYLVVAQPLDFESSATYKLQIDARNPEPLKKGLEYGAESTAFVLVSLTDVDENPEFSLDVLHVTVPENTTRGSVLVKVEAKDPEGKEISFKLDGDTQGWLEIDAATGEIKTKANLDRETLESFEVTVTAFEKENPDRFADSVVYVRLLDVNDNYPKLTATQAFICVKKPEPVVLQAHDTDSAPFSHPFTFAFAHGKKSPNWDLRRVDDTSAKLTLKKAPTEDKTFILPITIKDNAGMGITHAFEVKVCDCTELGYCYIQPGERGSTLGIGATVGILVGTLAFCVIAFIVVIKRVNKGNKKGNALSEEEDRNMM